jgi:serine/threonine-protein kinase
MQDESGGTVTDDIRRLGDRYELGEVIGRGGMAEVFAGRDMRLDRRVAVKILRPDLARDPNFQERFRREAQSAASLNHPNIVAVYDTGEDVLLSDDGAPGEIVPYIIMEFVEGITLRELMASGRRLLPERALEISSGVLAALDYSHRHGIIHRDIKPANVMLTRGGDVKVMDFGIARALADAGNTMTQASEVLGTAHYLSPEQARGEIVDSRSDIYSAGCLLYELLAGRPPFTGDSPISIAYQHVSEMPTPPSQWDAAVSPTIDAIVMRAMAKRPEDRYQSAAEMRDDIERAISGIPITAPVAVVSQDTAVMAPIGAAPVAVAEEQRKRGPGFWIALTLGVLGIGLAAFFIGKALFGSSNVAQVTVPNLSGLTIQAATTLLEQQGLVLGNQTPQPSPDKPKDTIIGQLPTTGDMVDKGSRIDVTISTGKQQVTVPNLVGLTSSDTASSTLVSAGLVLGNITPVDSDQPAGWVVAQNPPNGSVADAGTAIDISVSSGKTSVPSVVNESEAQAKSDLANAGFQVNVVYQQDSQVSAGTVLAQSPKGGSTAVKGTLVTITVAVAPSPSPSPTPTTPSPTPTTPTPTPTTPSPTPTTPTPTA